MSPADTSSSEFFEAMYRHSADPWNFAHSAYESSRYDAILRALSHRRYHRAFEPGCSVGVLTERLASICDAVEASDFSPTAVDRARQRCAHLSNVDVRCQPFPPRQHLDVCDNFGTFDLIVLSEIGYYFEFQQWSSIVANLVVAMRPGTILLAAHWLGNSADHRISGDRVHEILASQPLLHLEHAERHAALQLEDAGFRLDRLVRA